MLGEVFVTGSWGVSSRQHAQFILDSHAGLSGGHRDPPQLPAKYSLLLRAWRSVDAVETCG